MKSLLIFLLFIAAAKQAYAQKTFDLTVKITSMENQKGLIEIGLYNDAKKFPKVGQTLKMIRLKPNGKERTYVFKDLKPGKYAVCTFHDENANKICDKNILGIPTEAFAFSNNIRPIISVPTFEQCATNVDKNKSFTIKMVY
jgi:uncharacterized protein (DUF2141 family)